MPMTWVHAMLWVCVTSSKQARLYGIKSCMEQESRCLPAAFLSALNPIKNVNGSTAMTRYVMLNNLDHIGIKVNEHFMPEQGDNKAAVLTFPTEFSNVQKEYPILLSRDPATGNFQAVALLGLQKDENLFLEPIPETDHCSWSGQYIPAVLAKGPFITGIQEDMDGRQEAMVYIDLDSPKLGEGSGKSLFLAHGGNSPYLDYVTRLLSIIQQGKAVGDAMFAALAKLDLIEPITINIDLANGSKIKLSGYYTISEEKLSQLTGEVLEQLNKQGYLQGVFLIINSLSNIEKLIKLKNARL
ncbi:SapC family protein [Cellvibrio japonicus]|nr:SapC family protein [Cellvibrio japonicus]QEI17407.1 SapC family protein [Cellvibrio japonicus]QEI20983.1 SapC family protein [Cellvibrio japonicus]